MLEILRDFVIFISGVFGTLLALAWRHRKLVGRIAGWAVKALEDGRITRRELAELLKILGQELEDPRLSKA